MDLFVLSWTTVSLATMSAEFASWFDSLLALEVKRHMTSSDRSTFCARSGSLWLEYSLPEVSEGGLNNGA
jgi:hypothetical protein